MELIFTLNDIDTAAKQLITKFNTVTILTFNGEMGAGKTTLIKAICAQMDVTTIVTSPTFSIINVYTTKKNETIYHMDLYRIKDETEAIDAGVEDCIFSGNTCLIEWPEKIPALLPKNTLHITITAINNTTRKITVY